MRFLSICGSRSTAVVGVSLACLLSLTLTSASNLGGNSVVTALRFPRACPIASLLRDQANGSNCAAHCVAMSGTASLGVPHQPNPGKISPCPDISS